MKSNGLAYGDRRIDRLLKVVLESPKYRNVCEDLVRDIGSRELSKQLDLKKAIKSTKNKLHQISGAYFLKTPNYKLWLEKLRGAKESGNEDSFRKACIEVMSYHYSTKQRLSILSRFYPEIFSHLPPVHSIMDVACGFNPLSIPWMPFPNKVKYYAYDVYKDLEDFLNDFFTIVNVQGLAETRDVVANTPNMKTDLAFVLSTLPCLEQIEKSASLRILEAINSDFIVVSYPVRSLGGMEKGMIKHYTTRFNEITKDKDWIVHQLDFEAELIFLVAKQGRLRI